MSDVFWAAFGGAAAAGFITLVAVLVAEWYRWFLDRPLVNVEVSLGFLITPGSVSETRWLFLEARNPHTKPVMLSTFGLSFKQGKWGMLQVTRQPGYQFPYQLDGGKSLQLRTTMQSVIEALYKDGRASSDLKWVWFRASSGKLYRSKIKKLVIEELQKESRKMNVG